MSGFPYWAPLAEAASGSQTPRLRRWPWDLTGDGRRIRKQWRQFSEFVIFTLLIRRNGLVWRSMIDELISTGTLMCPDPLSVLRFD